MGNVRQTTLTLTTRAVYVGVDSAAGEQVTIRNASGSTLYYGEAEDVDSGDTSVAEGASATFTDDKWIVSAGTSQVSLTTLVSPSVEDLNVADDVAVTGDLVVAGLTDIGAGGLDPISTPGGVANWQPVAATSGTDTTPANGTQFVTSIFIPGNMTITNVNYLIGSVGGTDKVYAALYSSSGALLGNSSVSGGGATVGTAANLQTLALTSTYAAKGPGRFFVGVSMNGNTARLRTIPAFCQAGRLAGSVSQTHGTVAAITAPSTFTADKAPVVFLD